MEQIVSKPARSDPTAIETALGIDKAGRRKARRWPWLAGALALVALAGALSWALVPGSSAQPLSYQTEPAMRGPLVIEITATGSLQPLTQVDVSSELSGVVRSVDVVENQIIKRGDVLATLDTTRLEAQVERAEASVLAAEARVQEVAATLREADQQLVRTRSLSSRGMVADQALETAEASRERAASAVSSAEANLAIARADLKLQEADLAKSTLYAPIDGIVLTRDVDPGQTVASSLSAPVLFVIAENLETMVLEAAIDEADIGQVAKGQSARFTVDAFPGRRFDAEIVDIAFASVVTENVVTYKSRLAVDNSDLLLRPGMTATVTVLTREEEDVLTVPTAAFRFRPAQEGQGAGRRAFSVRDIFAPPQRGPRGLGGGRTPREGGERAPADSRTLFVMENGVPKAVRVRTGATDGERTEILSGLEGGEEIVVGSMAGPAS